MKQLVLSLILMVVFGGLSSGQPLPDYENWAHSTHIYLDTTESGSQVAGSVTGFPVLIRLDSSNFDFSQAEPNGEDIRFSQAGAALSYEIESWSTIQAAVWVKVPVIHGSDKDQYITMYWGAPAAADESSGPGVFGAGSYFAGVWHLSDNQASSTVQDATGLANGTLYDEETITMNTQDRSLNGNIGRAMTFDGDTDSESGDHIVLADIDYGPDEAITVSAWAKTAESSQPGAGDQGYILAKHQYTGDSPYTLELSDDNNPAVHFNGEKCDFDAALNDGRWHHLAGVRYDDHATLYVDGVERCTRDDLDSGDTDAPAAIGSHPDRAEYRPFKGDIDEVRISRVNRSADWVKLCYENQRPDQTLVKMAGTGGEPSNILLNGSFEEGLYSPTGLPDYWTWNAWRQTSDFIWDDSQARTGDKSVKIDAPVSNDARWIQTVDVDPLKNYCLSGWIKTDNVGQNSGSTGAGANLSLYDTWTHSAGVFGTSDWTCRSFEFNSGSATQVTIGARLGYWSATTSGTAWFDDLQLKPIPNPDWKILVLIYQEVDFAVTDAAGDHHYVGSMTQGEMDQAAEAARQFVETDIPALTSGNMVPEITVRFPARALNELSPFMGKWWPDPGNTTPERDPAFDSVIVIWEPNVNDLEADDPGKNVWIGYGDGLTAHMGTGQTYATLQLAGAIHRGHRNVFKHEWGHSILNYFDAMGLTPTPKVTNHATSEQYVNCETGEYYEWVSDNSVPNSQYNNESGFTHDYYSGTIALAEDPFRCIGIGPEAWILGGPVSHSANICDCTLD